VVVLGASILCDVGKYSSTSCFETARLRSTIHDIVKRPLDGQYIVQHFILRSMENIASVDSNAQYHFSLCRKVVQCTSSEVNSYGYETKRSPEKIYFRLY
jgi:hypothetical protein